MSRRAGYGSCRKRRAGSRPEAVARSSMCRLSEIGFLDRGILAYALRRVAGDDLAIDKHGDAIGDAEHDAHIVLDHEQRLAFRHFAHERDRVLRLRAAHAGHRLVEEDDASAAGDGDADFERALLGIGEHARLIAAARGKPDAFHYVFAAL